VGSSTTGSGRASTVHCGLTTLRIGLFSLACRRMTERVVRSTDRRDQVLRSGGRASTDGIE